MMLSRSDCGGRSEWAEILFQPHIEEWERMDGNFVSEVVHEIFLVGNFFLDLAVVID